VAIASLSNTGTSIFEAKCSALPAYCPNNICRSLYLTPAQIEEKSDIDENEKEASTKKADDNEPPAEDGDEEDEAPTAEEDEAECADHDPTEADEGESEEDSEPYSGPAGSLGGRTVFAPAQVAENGSSDSIQESSSSKEGSNGDYVVPFVNDNDVTITASNVPELWKSRNMSDIPTIRS
jgi:hypothetical protein